MIELIYDIPVEVTELQFCKMMNEFSGMIAGRQDEETGKYYIKLWGMNYKLKIEAYFNGK